MPPKFPKRMSKKHADGCICEKCLPKHMVSNKPAVHLRFSNEPEQASACVFVECKSDLPLYLGTDRCAECYGNKRRELESDILSLLQRAKLLLTANEYREIWKQQLTKFHSSFDDLPFEPVALKYVLNQFFRNESKLGLKEKRKIMSKKFSELLKIQSGPDGKWICCKNRFDASDLCVYSRILHRQPTPIKTKTKPSKSSAIPVNPAVSEDDEVENLSNFKIEKEANDSSNIADEPVLNVNFNTDEEDETPKGDSNGGVTMDTDEDTVNAVAVVHNSSDFPGGSSLLKLPRPSDDTNESDESVEIAGVSMSDAVSGSRSSDSDSDVEFIIVPVNRKIPPVVVVLEDSESDNGNGIENNISSPSNGITPQTNTVNTEKARRDLKTAEPGSRCSVKIKKPKRKRMKKVPRRSYTRADFVVSPEEDGDFVPPSSTSSSDSYDSDASSVIRSSEANESEEAEDESNVRVASDIDGSGGSHSQDRRIPPIVIRDTIAESRAKDRAKNVAGDDWRKLEREREDYEEKVLWNVQFLKRPLSYAVKEITRKLGWNVFPFGAKTLNRGRISRKQLQNPNGGTWLGIKEQFIKRYFKTAISITPYRGNWYCCKNQVDKLNPKTYLRKYWKIVVK